MRYLIILRRVINVARSNKTGAYTGKDQSEVLFTQIKNMPQNQEKTPITAQQILDQC